MSGCVNFKCYLVPNHEVLALAGTMACSKPTWSWPSPVTLGPHLASNHRACVAVFTNTGHLFFFFLAALSLRCCVQAFSSCERGLLFIAGRGLLIAVASLVVERRH